MLHPKHNRIDYGEQLIPPEGYELTRAIGTSYSLDLEALMLLPVALFYAQHLDGNPDEIRFDMLEAITKASEKITVFYQNGQLKVPNKYHPLIAYWENGIKPVTMPHHASSFHPKVWIIRYDAKNEPAIYRLVVTSRNLTFDRSWDVAFSTMGYVTEKPQITNQPLLDFLEYLSLSTNTIIPESFSSDLKSVSFEKPDSVKSLKFWPIGVPVSFDQSKKHLNPVSQKKWEELLIISPFLDDASLNTLKDNCYTVPYLLSTKEALDAIAPSILDNFNCWQFSDFFEKAEYYKELEEEGIEPCQQSLHAKLFITTQNGTPHWLLGSANCTDPAQGRNIEFLTELLGKDWVQMRPKTVFKSLTEPQKADGITLFVPFEPSQRVDMTKQKIFELTIRKIKFDLAALIIKGKVTLIPGGTAYDLVIEIDATTLSLPKGFVITYRPLAETQKKESILKPGGINLNTDYGGYAESWLSPYLEFTIKNDITQSHFLLAMRIDLPQSRLNKIFTSIIDSREKFLRYLAFLLTGEETGIIADAMAKNGNSRSGENQQWRFDSTPVFEKLMLAASRHPEKLTSVDKLIERIKQETLDGEEPIISTEFDGFWGVFRDFMNSRK